RDRDSRHELNREGHEAIGHDVPEGGGFLCYSVDEVADAAVVMESKREALQLGVQIAAQFEHHPLSEKLGEITLTQHQQLPEDKRCDHRSEEHTSELQSRGHLVCRLLLEK